MNPIKKKASVHDERDGIWRDKFCFKRLDHSMGLIEIPRDECTPAQLHKRLLAAGAALPEINDCRDDLSSAIAEEVPVERRPAMHGWDDDGSGAGGFASFAFAAQPPSAALLLTPSIAGGSGVGISGSLKGWQRIIQPARYSTIMLVLLSAVFGAPLLSLIRRPNFGLVVFGPSRAGKSTAQLVAASAIGFGTEEHMPILKATDAGLLSTGLQFNDHMLPINEVASARGSKEQVTEAIREATYSLMGGHDILRHPCWNGHTAAPSAFKVICVMSSEFPLEEWAARGGAIRDPGESARLISVPAIFEGAATVFDMLPPNKTSDWTSNAFSHMRRWLPHHRGVAFHDYINRLVRDTEAATERAREIVSQFEAKLSKPSMSLVERDIVAKFGVLVAGGFQAIEFGILPFEKRFVGAALSRACHQAIVSLPDRNAVLKKDVAKLRHFLTDLLSAERQSIRRRWSDADGFSRTGSKLTVTVRAKCLTNFFPETAQLRRMLEWCDDEGLLQHSKSRSHGRSIEWAEKQVSWPDGTRPRSVIFELPRGLEEFDRVLKSSD